MKTGFTAVFLLLTFTVAAGAVDLQNCTDPDKFISLLDMKTEDALQAAGGGYTEVEPASIGSRADRIVYYPGGMTIWFSAGRTVQIRLDSSWQGSTENIKTGDSREDIIGICGRPWIEQGNSLYYNLPWQGMPVRLRFIIGESGLEEIYLYKVF